MSGRFLTPFIFGCGNLPISVSAFQYQFSRLINIQPGFSFACPRPDGQGNPRAYEKQKRVPVANKFD